MGAQAVWPPPRRSPHVRRLPRTVPAMSGVAISRGDVIKEGPLVKESRYMKSWRRRHFVLTQQFFCSFKTMGDYRSPTEVIRLSECSTVKSCEEEIGKENAF